MLTHSSFVRSSSARGRATRWWMIAGVLAVTLTGCAGPVVDGMSDDRVPKAQAEEKVPDASAKSSSAAQGGSSRAGTVSVPSDFPSSVPLPDKAPTQAVSPAGDGGQSWILQYHAWNDTDAVETLKAELRSRGFSEETNGSVGGGVSVALYKNAEHTVSVGLLGKEGGDQILQIMVLPAGKN